ncbi:MAG: hypothetical protein RR052_06395 [Oscillospiraceae bacterium]
MDDDGTDASDDDRLSNNLNSLIIYLAYPHFFLGCGCAFLRFIKLLS